MYTSVSFRLTDENQPLILVPTFVNGEGPFDFILDTGAGQCLLSPELAQKLEVRPTESKEAAGAGGKIKVDIAAVHSISVGGARVESVTVAITQELKKIGACCGTKIDGGLGHSFFKGFRLTIDYRDRLLTFDDPGLNPDAQGAGNGGPIRFQLAHASKPLAVVPVHVNGKGPYPFVLDTGASMTVLSSRVAHDLDVAFNGAPVLAGAGGTASASLGVLRTLKIGPTELESVQVVVSDFLENLSRIIEADVLGIIGYNVLSGFSVTIDYPKATLTLS